MYKQKEGQPLFVINMASLLHAGLPKKIKVKFLQNFRNLDKIIRFFCRETERIQFIEYYSVPDKDQCANICKLDGVGPVDNRPSPD